ncbi:hypothetical protein ARTHRO9AX_30206 [Arthrobacter sp. 9AX]|nr:hypothetical protein ARTHRO9AX_30206 [Arthrobacter sp. 9AX]
MVLHAGACRIRLHVGNPQRRPTRRLQPMAERAEPQGMVCPDIHSPLREPTSHETALSREAQSQQPGEPVTALPAIADCPAGEGNRVGRHQVQPMKNPGKSRLDRVDRVGLMNPIKLLI